MRHPFIVAGRGGWWHAYSSKWAWFRGKEPVLRTRTWAEMEKTVEDMKSSKGGLLYLFG